MDETLEPWMLRADWRGDSRPFVFLDLDRWPTDLPIAPLPPVPVLARGDPSHPRAGAADVIADRTISFEAVTAGIAAAPVTAALLVHVLRATQEAEVAHALTTESLALAAAQGGAEHRAWLSARPPPPATPSPPGDLHLSRHGDRLAIELDRPAARNAIDVAMRDALRDAFDLAELDGTIDTVRLGAAGRCFSMGADLAEFGSIADPATSHAIRARTLPAHVLARGRFRLEAHVQGGCVGSGLELAAFADRLTATPDAWFQLPEVAMGIIPGFGGCVSVPRRIGRQRAAALMLSGRRIRADTALRWGLVDAIVDDPPGDDRRPHEIG